MATDNLKRLSLKLLATELADGGSVYVTAKDYQATTIFLPEPLRSDVNELVTAVLSIVPNDFAFWFFFGSDGAALSIEFDDGNTGSTAFDGRFTSRKSMLSKLRAIDWDEKRTELIEGGGIFERMVSDAADRPPAIPCSREAAMKYGRELDSIFAKLKTMPQPVPFVMVVVREDEIEVNDYQTRGEVVFEMAEVMTVGFEILSVVENGACWDFESIETAKREAVEELGPISRAKAERRIKFL